MTKVQGDKVKKNKSFSLKDKKRMIDAVKVAKAKGESVRSVSTSLGISNSTLVRIIESEAEILARLVDNPNSNAKV